MKRKLADLCTGYTKNIALKDLEDRKGSFPVYGASGFIKNIDYYVSDVPYIAVVKDGAGAGRVFICPEKSSLLGTMQYIVPNKEVDIRYLSYAIQNLKLGSTFQGSTIPHIYFKDYKEKEINFVPYDEQVVKASKLEEIEKAIDISNHQLLLLDEVVKSRFIEMFGEYSATAKLSDVAVVSGGLTKNSKREKLPLKMPYLRVANVAFGSIDVSEMLNIGLTEDEFNKTLLRDEDLLFVEGNGSPDQIGRVAIWRDEIKPCVHQNHLIKARFNKSIILPVFAMYYFMTLDGRNQIKRKAVSTSGLYTLSVLKVSDLVLPVPSLKLQYEFSSFVEQVDKSKLVVKKSLSELEELRDSLMQKYFFD